MEVDTDLKEFSYEEVGFEDLLICDQSNKLNETNSRNLKFFSFNQKNVGMDEFSPREQFPVKVLEQNLFASSAGAG